MRPPGMPRSLYPLFFPILMPLGFIVGFALLAFLWEATKPTSEFGGLQWGLLPFALLSIGWGMYGIYHDLITDFWSVFFIPHLNETGVYAVIVPLYLLFRPSRKILVATFVYSVFALGSAVLVFTFDAGFLENVFSWVGTPTTWGHYLSGRMSWGIYQDTLSEAAMLVMAGWQLRQWRERLW